MWRMIMERLSVVEGETEKIRQDGKLNKLTI